jgi:phosphonate transport system ATP-binding protein
MTSSEPIFQVNQISLRFGQVYALENINLQIYPGEKVALVGASGAGKSTLLSLLNGTLEPSEGEVKLLGRNLSELSQKARRNVQGNIGTIYQQFHLVDNLRVVHNVNAGHLGRWSFWQAALSLVWPLEVEKAVAALTRVGIPEKLYDRTDQLSGGQQQRVAIARVLVQDPAAILADEPISSLDPERSREVMDLLRDLSEQTGKTLVTSLHSIAFARSHCDRIIGLRHGRLFFDVRAEELTEDMVGELYRI